MTAVVGMHMPPAHTAGGMHNMGGMPLGAGMPGGLGGMPGMGDPAPCTLHPAPTSHPTLHLTPYAIHPNS